MKVIVTIIIIIIDVTVFSICVYPARDSVRFPVDCDTMRIKFASLLTFFLCRDPWMLLAAGDCSFTKLLLTPSGRASSVNWIYCCMPNDSDRKQTMVSEKIVQLCAEYSNYAKSQIITLTNLNRTNQN